MKFTVDRKTWLRGEGSTESRLLRSRDGKMCCLGFFALACGLSEDDIRDVAEPGEFDPASDECEPFVEWDLLERWEDDDDGGGYRGCTSNACSSLIEINDAENMPESKRETSLKELFDTLGVEVEFVD